jgi:RNA polymerase sigma factor (sigma-70 family)
VTDFDEFYETVYPRVSATLVVAFSDRDLAADAADEAFVRAYAAWDRVSRMTAPDGWVFRVALNLGRRQARKAARRRTAEQLAVEGRAPAVAPPSVLEFAEQVGGLPERQRVAVILRYVADLREQDIAEVMGIRRGTVASLLTTAHRSLNVAETATETLSPGGPS